MVRSCCVKNCNIAPKDTCFRFPNNRLLKRKWIDAIGLSSKLGSNSTVCIKHFRQGDYDVVRGRPRLKAKVIPSVFCESDRRSLSPSFTEDELIPNEVGTKTTVNNIQNEGEADEPSKSPLRNDGETKLQDDNDDAHAEDNTKLRLNQSTTLNAKARSLLLSESGTELSNENGIESQIKDKTESENIASQNVQNERTELLDHTNDTIIQSENCTKSPHTGSTQNNNNTIAEEVHKNSKSKHNGVILKEKKVEKRYQDSFIESTSRFSNNVEDLNKDIEDIIVNYQIKQTRPVHTVEVESIVVEDNDKVEGEQIQDELQKESDPVFIEVAVQGDRTGSPCDCVMVLESVEVELDPSTFLADGEPDDCMETVDLADDCHETVDLAEDDDVDDKPDAEADADADADTTGDATVDATAATATVEAAADADADAVADADADQGGGLDPISLLTSSDEDEVIIQEPHIDTVEVSDETDEDDVPLVKLLKKPKKKKKPKVSVWNAYEYFCMDCQYTATSRQEYRAHTAKHSTILQVCEICDYTTASKSQFSRHKRKHKEDRKYKCHLCDYKARHNMSLIYHLKSHRALSSAKKGFKCDKCGFKSDIKTVVLKHVKLCTTDGKKYSCDKCVYETKRLSDLKRHKARRHNEDQGDDEEFVP